MTGLGQQQMSDLVRDDVPEQFGLIKSRTRRQRSDTLGEYVRSTSNLVGAPQFVEPGFCRQFQFRPGCQQNDGKVVLFSSPDDSNANVVKDPFDPQLSP